MESFNICFKQSYVIMYHILSIYSSDPKGDKKGKKKKPNKNHNGSVYV